jgi:hypothetical protein
MKGSKCIFAMNCSQDGVAILLEKGEVTISKWSTLQSCSMGKKYWFSD